jgi:hypothetical protein
MLSKTSLLLWQSIMILMFVGMVPCGSTGEICLENGHFTRIAWGCATGLLGLRGGAILNDDEEILRGERERKREKRMTKSVETGCVPVSTQPRQQQARKLVALRSNPSAGAPLPPPGRRPNSAASPNAHDGSLLSEYDDDESIEDVTRKTCLPNCPRCKDTALPKWTEPDDVPIEDELCEALNRARLEVQRQEEGDVSIDAPSLPNAATQVGTANTSAFQFSSRPPQPPALDIGALLAQCKYMEATGTDDKGNKMTDETALRYAEDCEVLLQKVLAKMENGPRFSKEGPSGVATGEWSDVQGLPRNIADFARSMGFKPACVKLFMDGMAARGGFV